MLGHFQDSSKRVCSRYEWLSTPRQQHPYHRAVLFDCTGGITWFAFEAVFHAVAKGRKPYATTRTRCVVVRTSGGTTRGVALGVSLLYIQTAGLAEGLRDRAEVLLTLTIAAEHILVLDLRGLAVTCLCLYNG